MVQLVGRLSQFGNAWEPHLGQFLMTPQLSFSAVYHQSDKGTCISPELKPETLLIDFVTLYLSFNLCKMDKTLILLSDEDSMDI